MDLEPPGKAKADARALRARALILIVMAVFIIAPVIQWLLSSRGGPQMP